MGWVLMSERDLKRIEVLAQIDDGRLTIDNGANMLCLTRRQVFRLLKRYRLDGAAAIRLKARGKPPNNRVHKAKREYALTIIKESYADFGPTLATEVLAEQHGFNLKGAHYLLKVRAAVLNGDLSERTKYERPKYPLKGNLASFVSPTLPLLRAA